ncbi:MAG: helix-turn-helix transcriptional regulator [Pseudonocardiales bacterium]|nr:helix-turn-helix transcriptional regulator [Pseudonocardiales bacterium]
MNDWDRLRDELTREFAYLYESAKAARGLTERELARQLDSPASSWSQTKVSRVRRGDRAPSVEDARALALAMGATADKAGEIEELALRIQDERPEVAPTRVILDRGGSANFQRRLGRVERRAAAVAAYHPLMVHGLLQTEPYMLAIRAAATDLPDDHPDTIDWLAARRHNQKAGLASGKPYTMLIAETALYGPLLAGREMADQVEHIGRISLDHQQVRIGLIPLGRAPAGRPVYALHGFDLYFDQQDQATGALYGTQSGTALVNDANELAKYRDLLDRHLALAEFGESGRAILARAASRHREDV